MANYTDQSTVEAFLERSLTANELTLLPIQLDSVDSFINDQIGSSFEAATESTRYYDGGSKILNLDAVRSVSKIAHVDAEEVEITEYILNEDFELRPRNETIKEWVESRFGKFPHGVANIAVTGVFSTAESAPSDIVYLATYLVAKMYSDSIKQDLKSESIEGYSRAFSTFLKDDQIVFMTLNKYIKDDVLI